MEKGTNGHAVDRAGNTVADPSLNVGSLVDAAEKRQDDLRLAEQRRQDDLRLAAKELADINNLHAKEIAVLRDAHSTAMAIKESSRIDSLRQGDREETTRATIEAQRNISTLAATTTQMKDTLAAQVANTAGIAETRQAGYAADVNKHFAEIDRALSEGKGKQQLADPAYERLAGLVEKLTSAQQVGTGEKKGTSDGIKLVIAILTVISLYLGLQTISKPAAPDPEISRLVTLLEEQAKTTPAPQVTYLPAPSVK